MIKRLGIIFSGLLILLLLSNINSNANVQVLAQQNTSVSTTNTSVPIVSSDTSIEYYKAYRRSKDNVSR